MYYQTIQFTAFLMFHYFLIISLIKPICMRNVYHKFITQSRSIILNISLSLIDRRRPERVSSAQADEDTYSFEETTFFRESFFAG